MLTRNTFTPSCYRRQLGFHTHSLTAPCLHSWAQFPFLYRRGTMSDPSDEPGVSKRSIVQFFAAASVVVSLLFVGYEIRSLTA